MLINDRLSISSIVWTLVIINVNIDKVNGGIGNIWTPSQHGLNFLNDAVKDDNDIPPFLFRKIRQTQRRCQKTQWTCNNGQCIALDQHCDGKYDCRDNSDENAITCRDTKCYSYLFQCEYGACVDGDAQCNNKIDCVDGSDELDKHCNKSSVLVNNCGKNNFQCRNSECIMLDEVCDGVRNCDDGTDETLEQCSGNHCKSYLFKCAYGACVDGDAECNGIRECADGSDEAPELCNKGSVPLITTTTTTQATIQGSYCILPPFPEKGRYKYGSVTPTPGTRVPISSALRYECDKNYNPTPIGFIYCDDTGLWSDNVVCTRNCDRLESSTVNFVCTYQGKPISCSDQMLNGTVVTTTCAVRHIPPQGRILRALTCISGSWDNATPYCVPECGEEKLKTALPQAIGAYNEFRGNSPWHVGIYKKDENDAFQHLCGGTILTNKIIISAAHCFAVDSIGTILSAQLFAVGAGKYYRAWDHPDDNNFAYIQKILVDKIVAPPRYGGLDQNFEEDIALTILQKTLLFSDSVHPICYDLGSATFQNLQVSNGSLGKAVGWGVTIEGNLNSASEVLQAVTIPVIEYGQCRKTIPASLRRYLTSDKFCAGWLNGTALCSGDSGGGLVFKAIDKETERWYIRGVVSVGDSDETGTTCKKDVYTIFTNVFHHRDFILEVIENYK